MYTSVSYRKRLTSVVSCSKVFLAEGANQKVTRINRRKWENDRYGRATHPRRGGKETQGFDLHGQRDATNRRDIWTQGSWTMEDQTRGLHALYRDAKPSGARQKIKARGCGHLTTRPVEGSARRSFGRRKREGPLATYHMASIRDTAKCRQVLYVNLVGGKVCVA